jgi:hypothetical protein
MSSDPKFAKDTVMPRPRKTLVSVDAAPSMRTVMSTLLINTILIYLSSFFHY